MRTALLAVVLPVSAYAQTPTVNALVSSVPALAWHNVLPPLADGTAWACGGQTPGSYNGGWGVYQTCSRINLTTGAVVQTAEGFGYGYGHSPAFQLPDGRVVVIGGQGAAGAAFQNLDVAQEWQPASPTQVWQHSLSDHGHGPGYDISGVMLSPNLMLYAGGHGTSGGAGPSWARVDVGTIDFSTSPPTFRQFPGLLQGRVYATVHALNASTAMFIGGWNYADETLERRNLDTIETVTTDGAVSLFPQRLSIPVRYHSSQMVAGKIVAFGGTSDPSSGRPAAIGNTNIIDTAAGTVTPGAAMNYPGYHMQSWQCTVNGKSYVYAFGGQSAAKTPRMVVEAYDVTANSWSVVGTLTHPSVDHDRITAVSGPDVYVLGGEDPRIPGPTNWLTHLAFGSGAACSRN